MHPTFDVLAALLVLAALFGFVNHRFLKLPRTIGILVLSVAASLLLIGIDVVLPGLAIQSVASRYLETAALPSALFDGALAFLMFAAAIEVSFADLWSRKGTILLLATLGVVLTAALIGLGMHWVFALLGLSVPLIWCLVLGAAVAPTDPVAVMGALRRVGLPAELQGTIAGESLFNDGVGIVLFAVLVSIATGAETNLTAASIGIDFVREAFGGAALGLMTGYVAYLAMRRIDEYDVELMISIALVAATYSLAQRLHLSGAIAVVVAGLLIGERAKQHAMSERTREHLEMVWSVIDEILNALLFLVIGLEILVIDIHGNAAILVAAAIAIVLSLAVRYVSVAALGFGLFGPRMRMRVVAVLTWAGLRGGISIALTLSIPASDHREALLAACYGIVLFTTLVQGLTLEPVARQLFPGNGGPSEGA
jgi:CPA1 family monovalent cation:H+ antiporter